MAWFRNLSKFTKPYQTPKKTDPFFLLPSFTFLSHFSSSQPTEEKPYIEPSGLEATKPHEKPRVVVLGSGWAGCRLMKDLDTSVYDIVCVSPRNHMVFTPLLASTCVGTLEFRSVAEPIGRIQPAISREPGSYFFLANCTAIHPHNHMSLLPATMVTRAQSIADLERKLEEAQRDMNGRINNISTQMTTNMEEIRRLLREQIPNVINPPPPPPRTTQHYATRLSKVHCETVTDGDQTIEPWKFTISYDKLVIALGSHPATFGIQGVKEHAIFLREVHHAQEIRRKLLLNLMLSDVPGITVEEKQRLLHCVVVGGGPTGVEFSGELSDFIMKDVRQRYAHVKDYIHVTLIEANEILSSFDDRLRLYATKQLTKSGVRLVRGIVKDVKAQTIILSDGTEVPYGLLVWSTGVAPSPIIQSMDLPKAPGGRIGVDEWLHVPSVQDVFSIGDCSGFVESTGRPTLPALAQVAERQGKYLAGLLNKIGKEGAGHANSGKEIELGDPFVYKHLGSMATIGRYKALVDLRQSKEAKGVAMAGILSFFIWRSAYITRVVSWRNRFYVFINWITTLVFGRDISRL